MTDTRKQELTVWANEAAGLSSPEGEIGTELAIVSGDASFRRYFRLNTGANSYIAVDAPPANEDSEAFVEIAELLRKAGVAAPRVLAVNYELGFMLLEDFGDELYLGQLLQAQIAGNTEVPERLYQSAIEALVALQEKVDKERLAPYDRGRLHAEMALFEEWFCSVLLRLELEDSDRDLLTTSMGFLEDAALSQPQLAVHRDYHSRNLLVLDVEKYGADTGPGVIDFQDAVTGAYTYDLVSLLRDCYVCWPQDQVNQWALAYLELATKRGVIESISQAQFQRDFDLMGLQRNLKVMGIFSRLSLRDKKPQYLADIPLVISYFLEVSSRYQELESLHNWFRQTVLPAAQRTLKMEN